MYRVRDVILSCLSLTMYTLAVRMYVRIRKFGPTALRSAFADANGSLEVASGICLELSLTTPYPILYTAFSRG